MKKWITALLAGISVCSVQATVIYSTDFTDAGTYSTGFLNGQDNWNTDGGGGVETTAGTGAVVSGFETAANSASTSASTATTGETYTSSLTFSFDDVSSGGNNAPVIGAAIYSGPESTNSLISGILQKNQGNYRFQLRSDWGNSNTSLGFTQSVTFTPEDMGITIGSDQASDLLTLSLAMTAGANANSWDATVTLFNETTATQVLQWTPTSGDLVFADLGGAVYGGFVGGQSDSNAQVANRTGTAYEFGSTIPEPATIGMLGIGTLVTLLVRKIRG